MTNLFSRLISNVRFYWRRYSEGWHRLKSKDVLFSVYSRFDKNRDVWFFLKSVVGKFQVSTESMSGNSLTTKLLELSHGKRVLEFGSGGSTLVFAKYCEHLISVESDFFYARKLRRMLKSFANAEILWANIGPTKAFGSPILSLRKFYKNRWREYAMRPWSDETMKVDLVFVDGRFRVSSAMQCFLNINSEFTLVFDDYFSRSEYHFVELFLGKPIEEIGDSALFVIPKQAQRDRIELGTWQEYDKYIYDHR